MGVLGSFMPFVTTSDDKDACLSQMAEGEEVAREQALQVQVSYIACQTAFEELDGSD